MIPREIQRKIIDMALEGFTLTQIRERLKVDARQLFEYRQADKAFNDALLVAVSEGLEQFADRLVTVETDEPDIYKAKLKSDNMKWLLARRKPHVYGEKLDLSVGRKVDISGALEDAKQRAGIKSVETNELESGDKTPLFALNTSAEKSGNNTASQLRVIPICYPENSSETQDAEIAEVIREVSTDYKSVEPDSSVELDDTPTKDDDDIFS